MSTPGSHPPAEAEGPPATCGSYLGSSGAWELWINNASGMVGIAGGTSTLNAWHHIVGTFDGTTARLYVNGVAIAPVHSRLSAAESRPAGDCPGRVGQLKNVALQSCPDLREARADPGRRL